MLNTFAKPTVNSASRLAVIPFSDIQPVILQAGASLTELEVVIRAIYRQVLGNAHVMESERLSTLESQFVQGNLTVRDFVRELAKSHLYRTRFFENCSRYRAIELNFKHLLGRAPESYDETTYHSHILDDAGYEADIDTYVDSAEYQTAFGDYTVPYYRGYKTQAGRSLVGFTYMSQLLRGSSASDQNLTTGNRARLTSAILTSTPQPIKPPSSISPDWRPLSDPKQIIAQALGAKYFSPQDSAPIAAANMPAASVDWRRQQQYQVLQRSETGKVERYPRSANEDIEVIIRAAYRQVLGNAYVMESERLQVPESQLKRGELSVREFVRCLAKSALYRTRFFDTCYRYRALELNFKHLLGRAPNSFEEMKVHSKILDEAGFDADIDSYLDSDEYQETFGENVVPYYRGYQTQTGQPLIGFTNMLQLLRSASSSDKSLTADNQPQLTRAVILNQPYGINRPRDAQDILREVFSSQSAINRSKKMQAIAKRAAAERALQQTIDQQVQEIERLQQQLADLRPLAVVGAVQLRNSWNPSTASIGDDAAESLQQQIDAQAAQIADLEAQILDARRYATIGEAKLNKWRTRFFRG
ncbi:MAG: phycobilisome rod-core linker polypeptide [Cyanobacteria bacterium P01_H01_bin.15]